MGAKIVGQPVRRVEDPRLLRGQGRFIEDLRLHGLLDLAFVRSQYAHARIEVDTAPALDRPGVVAAFGASDLQDMAGFRPIPTVVGHPALRDCTEPLLAVDKVRFVGEPIAVVAAESRALADDGAAAVGVEYDALPPVPDARAAVQPGSAALHEHLPDNLAAEFTVTVGDPDAVFASADFVFRDHAEVQRYSGQPMETRGVVAQWDAGLEQLTLWSSTQWPHTLRDALRTTLGLAESRIRVIAPDVGGGFGIKQEVYPEDLLLPLLAMRLGRPVRWIETRREHMATGVQAREQDHLLEIAANRDGTVLGLRAEVLSDIGAYTRSLGVLCPSLTAAGLPGPYRFQAYQCRVRAALTCKGPTAAYRGAGQPEAVFALERAMDHLAAELGMDPIELRRKNLLGPGEFPYDVGTESAQVPVVYDSGAYEAGVDRALEVGRYQEWRELQRQERAKGEDGRLIGIGLACYVMLTGLGPHESAQVRVDQSGKVHMVTGASPHGQGTATALAQIIADQLGLTPDDVTVQHGDTAAIPFGVGTYASRNAVMAGNAAHVAAGMVKEKVLALAAQQLEVAEADLELENGTVRVKGAPQQALTLAQVAAAFAPGAASLPDGLTPSLEATHYFLAPRATFASGAQVAVVEVDRETGRVHILDYCAVSDAGTLINPLVVDGQIHGGVAQGVGGALYEAYTYDQDGQLLSQTWMDYAIPNALQVPDMRVAHLETPSPLNPLGVKGLGEGGSMAPPPTLAAAVEDALAAYGARIHATPLTPQAVYTLMHAPA